MILLTNQHVIITLGLANECVKILSFPAVHLAKKQKLHACSQHPRLQLAPALAASTHARSHHDMRAASTGGGAQPKKSTKHYPPNSQNKGDPIQIQRSLILGVVSPDPAKFNFFNFGQDPPKFNFLNFGRGFRTAASDKHPRP